MAKTFGELKKGQYFVIAEFGAGSNFRKKISKTHQINFLTGERAPLDDYLLVRPIKFEPYELMKEIIKAFKS